jgi:hypothetical protein
VLKSHAAKSVEVFFAERGRLAMPTEHAEQLAVGRRKHRIEAVPASVRLAVQVSWPDRTHSGGMPMRRPAHADRSRAEAFGLVADDNLCQAAP